MSKKSASTNTNGGGLDMEEVFEDPEETADNNEAVLHNGKIAGKGKLAGYFHGLKKKLSGEKEKKSSVSRSNSTQSGKSNSHFYTSLTRKSRGSSLEEEPASGSLEGSRSPTPSPIIEEGQPGESPTRMDEVGNLNVERLRGENEPRMSNGGESTPSLDESSSHPFFTLTVDLVSGKNLVVKDKSGSSDPYVKVRLGEKTLYKSKVITENLNPVWNEKFVLPIDNLKELLTFKVVDYDWGSKDDFMGMSIVDLRKLPLDQSLPVTLPLTKKGVLGTKSMGELSVLFTLTPRTLEEKQIWFNDTAVQAQVKMQRQTWNGVLTVLLIDAHNLPARTDDPNGGYTNVFAKLRFGNEKRNSKHIAEATLKPEWLEQFDFYLFEGTGQAKVLEIQLFEESSVGRVPIGCCRLDTSDLEKDVTHEKTLKMFNGVGEVSILVTISGIRPFGVDAAPANAISSDALKMQYSLGKTLNLKSITDVGHLTVTVHEAEGLYAADLGGKSDPYCVLQLINTRVQTHTDYKTLTPKWNKTFHFPVRDITAHLEVTVYDEDRYHKSDFLGRIIIPLWRIEAAGAKWYKLKNRKLGKGARGKNPQILLEMNLIWNPIRAAVRVTDPQEVPYISAKPQLRIETFLINMERLRRIGMDVFDIWLYIKSCLDWEYPDRSIKALLIYQLFFFFFQPFFIPLLILIYWLRPWWKTSSFERTYISPGATSRPGSSTEADSLALDEDIDYEDEEIKKLSLVEKFTLLQDASGVLQELLGELASICESTINSRRMVVPFIYWLFVLLFAAATVILIIVPFRYVAMIFGLHEFSRVFLRPWKKSTFELYHMIRRVPDQQKTVERLGVNSVLKSIQQLKKPKRGNPLNSSKRQTSVTSPTATAWYAEEQE